MQKIWPNWKKLVCPPWFERKPQLDIQTWYDQILDRQRVEKLLSNHHIVQSSPQPSSLHLHQLDTEFLGNLEGINQNYPGTYYNENMPITDPHGHAFEMSDDDCDKWIIQFNGKFKCHETTQINNKLLKSKSIIFPGYKGMQFLTFIVN